MTGLRGTFEAPESWVPIVHDFGPERCFGPVAYLTHALAFGEIATAADMPLGLLRTADGQPMSAPPTSCSSCDCHVSSRMLAVLIHRHAIERLEEV